MNKPELILAVVEDTDIPKNVVTMVTDSLLKIIGNQLQAKEKVQLVGFGYFETRERKAKKGRNPQTGDEVDIPACLMPTFKPGKVLKDKVNE